MIIGAKIAVLAGSAYAAAIVAVATTTSGPAFPVHGWEAFLIIASILLGAAVGIWKLLWPFVRAVVHISDQWQSIDKLADQADSLVKIAEIAPKLLDTIGDVHNMAIKIEEHSKLLAEIKRDLAKLTRPQ